MTLAEQAAAYHTALLTDELALARLHVLRGWTREAIERLEVGERVERGRRVVTLPIRNRQGRLVNLLSYRPDPKTRKGVPKMMALGDKPRDLFPAPETIAEETVWLLEGEPDVVAGWSLGLACVGIPGASNWQRYWPGRFADKHVVILLDADNAGDAATERIAPSLARKALSVYVAELQEGDLTDVLLAQGPEKALQRLLAAREAARLVEPFRIHPISAREFVTRTGPRDPSGDLLGPLLRKGQRVIIGGRTGHGKTTLALQMISAAAYSESFLDWHGRPNGCRCLVIALEGDDNSVAQRITEMGLAERNGNVQIVHIPDGIDLEDEENRAAIERELATGYELVVLDPCYRLMQGEFKEEANAQKLVNILDRWRARYGCCIVVPLHVRKGRKGQPRLSVDDLYGSAVFVWNAEVVIGIQRRGLGKARLYWWKDRDGNLNVPIDGDWRLTFGRESYFQRDDEDEERPVEERVLELLRQVHPGGLTVDQIAERLDIRSRQYVSQTLNLLEAVGRLTGQRAETGGRRGPPPKMWSYVPQMELEEAA